MVVTTGGEVLLVEARNAAKHPTSNRTGPTTKNYPAQISVVPRLRDPL